MIPRWTWIGVALFAAVTIVQLCLLLGELH
jgi:hypothetical protein